MRALFDALDDDGALFAAIIVFFAIEFETFDCELFDMELNRGRFCLAFHLRYGVDVGLFWANA